MTRSLPPTADLEQLKREAKAILRGLRAGTSANVPLLQNHPKYSVATAQQILAAPPPLADVQHALALDYGFDDWPQLKQVVEAMTAAATPKLRSITPVLRMDSSADAIAHYVDWLGFTLDWEWREAPGQPAIIAISRDGITLMLNEAAADIGPASLHIKVYDLDALAASWNERRPGSAKVRIGLPYEFPNLPITDSVGNTLVFEDLDETLEEIRRTKAAKAMRAFVQASLDAGAGLPTPEAVRAAVGPPLGVAIEVLNEFPGYAAEFNARNQPGAPAGEEQLDP